MSFHTITLQHVCSPQSSSRYRLIFTVGETNSFPDKWVNGSIFAQTGYVQQLQLLNPLRRQDLIFTSELQSQQLVTHLRAIHPL